MNERFRDHVEGCDQSRPLWNNVVTDVGIDFGLKLNCTFNRRASGRR
jgi:hypothetical protein